MNPNGLREVIPFVTAGAAILGAVAAIVAAVFSALSHRRESAKGRTVIEAQALWHPRGLPTLPITVRNLGYETLEITAAEILRPRGSKVAVDSEGLFGLTPSFSPPQQQRIELTRVAFSLNEAAAIPLYFQPPRGWEGGWIKVRIEVSSLASEAKPRWVTVKRYLRKESAAVERADERRPGEFAA